MIVNSGEEGLQRCLQSVSGVVDRIVIGETGRCGQTRKIAHRHGAEVIPVAWNEDFAAARNAVLAHSCCDWILVLDADEMLDETAAALIPELLCNQAISAYEVAFCNYVAELGHRCGGEQALANPGTFEQARAFPAYFRTYSTRLFRRDPRIRFQHCVHENILDSLEAAALRRSRATFLIHHFGYADDARGAVRRKDERYYKLALKKLAEAPGDYQALLEVGIAEVDHAKRPAMALEPLGAAIALEPRRAVAWLYRGICLTRLGRLDEAVSDLTRAASLDACNPLVHSALADAHAQSGAYLEARNEYGRARELGDHSALSYAKLGSAEVQLGFRKEGLAKVQQAVAQSPIKGELLDILSTTALLAGEPALACKAASRRLAMGALEDFHFVLAATIHLHAGESAKAKLILDTGTQTFPASRELEDMRARVPEGRTDR